MKAVLFDGIVWVTVGVSLLGQGGFIVVLGWLPDRVEPGMREASSAAAGLIVASGFLLTGLGALAIGLRRFRASWNRR